MTLGVIRAVLRGTVPQQDYLREALNTKICWSQDVSSRAESLIDANRKGLLRSEIAAPEPAHSLPSKEKYARLWSPSSLPRRPSAASRILANSAARSAGSGTTRSQKPCRSLSLLSSAAHLFRYYSGRRPAT